MPRKTHSPWKRPRLDVPADDLAKFTCPACGTWLFKLRRSTGELADRHPGVNLFFNEGGTDGWDADLTCTCRTDLWVTPGGVTTRGSALDRRQAMAEIRDERERPPTDTDRAL